MPAVKTFERVLIPSGVYIMTLKDIEEKMGKQFEDNKNPNMMWIWKFRGCVQNDAEKSLVDYEFTTGTSVSAAKDSKLKSLLAMVYPDKSVADMKKFNTDEMIGKCYKIRVRVDVDKAGEKINSHTSIEEYDGSFDPFSDE